MYHHQIIYNYQKNLIAMATQDLQSYIPTLSALCREAGVAIMNIYADESSFGVEMKGDDSPLTQADKQANEIICKGLEEMAPHIPIVSEENREMPYETRKTYTESWLVDPVDGTKEFIKRNGEFTVNIALVRNGESILGFVYKPVGEVLYYAIKGHGSYKEENGVKIRLEAKTFTMSDAQLGVVCSRSHLNDETQAFLDALDTPKTVAKGSSLKFLVLAEGGAHLYPRLAPTMEWDTGAAQVVLEEAGGSVINHETKQPLRYNKENLRNPYFVAYGKVEE